MPYSVTSTWEEYTDRIRRGEFVVPPSTNPPPNMVSNASLYMRGVRRMGVPGEMSDARFMFKYKGLEQLSWHGLLAVMREMGVTVNEGIIPEPPPEISPWHNAANTTETVEETEVVTTTTPTPTVTAAYPGWVIPAGIAALVYFVFRRR